MFIILIKLNIFTIFTGSCRHGLSHELTLIIRIETFQFCFYLVITCFTFPVLDGQLGDKAPLDGQKPDRITPGSASHISPHCHGDLETKTRPHHGERGEGQL